MGLTFAALGLLIITIIVLERLFRPAPPYEEKAQMPVIVTEAQSEDEAIAVAIAVALAYFYAEKVDKTALGETLEIERGGWWRRGQSSGSRRRTSRKAGWQ